MEDKEQKYEEMYHAMLEFENAVHQKNEKRIKAGVVCIFVIPIAFLILMFLTDSSKSIFLLLWIISLYAIAIYLIVVEYSDYKLQKNLARFRGEDIAEPKALIGQGLENMEEILREVRGKIDEEHH